MMICINILVLMTVFQMYFKHNFKRNIIFEMHVSFSFFTIKYFLHFFSFTVTICMVHLLVSKYLFVVCILINYWTGPSVSFQMNDCFWNWVTTHVSIIRNIHSFNVFNLIFGLLYFPLHYWGIMKNTATTTRLNES